MIVRFDDSGVFIGGHEISRLYSELLRDWEFTDGSPCGKMVKE